jgi:aspartyl protease family protein
MRKPIQIILCTLLLGVSLLPMGCALIEFAGDTIVFAGKVTTTVVKTGVVIIESGVGLVAGSVRYFAGERRIPLRKEGNSYYVKAKLNNDEKYWFLLDTGATSMQISHGQALVLGIDPGDCKIIKVQLANGRRILARSVVLDEVQVGSVEVEDVHAIILPGNSIEGLMGMSFLGNFTFSIDPEESELVLKCQ